MKITTDVLAEYFQQFNRDYFGDGLPLPRLVLSHSRTRLGSFSCKSKMTWRGRKLTDLTIRISTYYNMTEWQMQNVLLHEMIHYSIAYTGLKDTSAHGVVFRGMMDNLNRKYGWEITVMQDTKGWGLSEMAQRKIDSQRGAKRLVLAMRTRDGRCFLSVVNPKFRDKLEAQIKKVPEIVWHQWFISSDEYFCNFPAVRTLRGRRVPEEQLKVLQAQ